MKNFSVEDAVIILTVVSVVLAVAIAVASFFIWKFYQKNKVQEQTLYRSIDELNSGVKIHGEHLSSLDAESKNTREYNKAMGKLMLEEQRSYLYSVALQIESLVKKNDLLVSHNLIDTNQGKARNSQLLVLKGGLLQYADALSAQQIA